MGAAKLATCAPVMVPPVKETRLTSGWETLETRYVHERWDLGLRIWLDWEYINGQRYA